MQEYDENRNVTKATTYNTDGTMNDYDVYEYDANGNEINMTRYHSDGTVW